MLSLVSLEGTIFQKRAAHGYFILAAGAGLFVYPEKGPVGANYGLEDCCFIRPVKMATGEVVAQVNASERAIDGAQTSLYNYRPMPGPLSQWIDLPASPQFDDLTHARQGVLAAYHNYEAYFKANPKATAATPFLVR